MNFLELKSRCSDKDREEWCLRQLRNLANSPPPLSHDAAFAAGSLSWGCFWSEAVVALLANDPENEEFWGWVGMAIMQSGYNAAACAMMSAWRDRDHLGDDIGQLINLAIVWAGIRLVLGEAHRHNREVSDGVYWRWHDRLWLAYKHRILPGDRVLDCVRLNRLFNRVIERMLSRAKRKRWQTSDLLDAEDDSGVNGPGRSSARRRRSLRVLGLNTGILGAVLSVARPLADAGAPRNLQISILRDMVRLVTSQIGPADETGEEIDGTPSEFDWQVFDVVASILPYLREGEHPEDIWHTILDLGPQAHYWVEGFLASWFINGFRDSTCVDQSFSIWRDMINYVGGNPIWQNRNIRSRFDLRGMWADMMAVQSGGKALCERAEFAPYLQQMEPMYGKWAEEWMTDVYSIGAFAYFITTAAGSALLKPGLIWLSKSVSSILKSGQDLDDAVDALTIMCAICWKKHRTDIDRSETMRSALLNIIAKLNERGHPEGLQLYDEILQSLANALSAVN